MKLATVRWLSWSVSLVVLLAAVAAAPASARRNKAPTAPGKYTDWGADIDELEIVESFKLSDYDRVVISQFDGSATPLPESDDNAYTPVKQVLGDSATPFLEGFREADGPKLPAALGSADVAEPRTLLIRAKVLSMDPGSRAGRYFGGIYGAGGAEVQVAGEVSDAASGRVLLRFIQARRSSVSMWGGGGSYGDMLNRDLRTIGEDVAGILQAF